MRAQSFGFLSCGALVLGSVLAACGGDETPSPSGGQTGGTTSVAGTGNAAAGTTSAAAGTSGAQGGTSSAAGTTGFAGASGSFSQAGSSGSIGTGGGGAGSGGASGGTGGTPSGSAGSSGSTGTAGTGGSTNTPAVKLVVYLDDWTGNYTSWANKVDFSKMTHLNLAFYTATTGNNWNDASGQSDSDVKALVAKAHAAGVKVLVSLGGGGGDSSVVKQYSNTSNDDALVSNLDSLISRLNLDGADIDIEKEDKADVGDNYGTFVSKVVAKLRPEGKLITAAVAPYLQVYMNDDTLHLFDFVNIMTYSTNTADYTSALKYYTETKNMDKTKLTLGVISESDQHTSVSTTKAIAAIAKTYGGAMLWDLAEDSTGSSSVYKALQDSM